MKTKKAPGFEDIYLGLTKATPEIPRKILTAIFNKYLQDQHPLNEKRP